MPKTKAPAHTPAPWTSSFDDMHILGSNGAVIADIYPDNRNFSKIPATEAEIRANGNLIIAAPDLLAACKFFVNSLESGLLVRDITHDAESTWALKMLEFVRDLSQSQAAIAKAEGR